MKKIVLALAILLSGITAKAQIFPFAEVDFGHFGIAFQAGAIGIGKEVTRAAFGANLLAYGVYLDFLYAGPQHKSDPKVDIWNDSSGYSVHLGYQIPITEYLRIIPFAGYAEVNRGVTDGTDYSYEYSTTNKRWNVNNKYTKDWRAGGFDAGGSLVINIGPANIFLTGTMSSAYGGIGVEF